MCRHKILAPQILARSSRTAERLSDNCPTKLFEDSSAGGQRERGRFFGLHLQKGDFNLQIYICVREGERGGGEVEIFPGERIDAFACEK